MASDVRRHLIHALQAELIGPYDPAPGGDEFLGLPPSRRYLAGFLAPPDLEATPSPQAAEEGEAAAGESEEDEHYEREGELEGEADDTPDPEPATRKVFPASVGLSVLLPREATAVIATLRWAEYRRDLVRDPAGAWITQEQAEAQRRQGRAAAGDLAEGQRGRAWRRLPPPDPPHVVEIPLDPAKIAAGIAVAPGVSLEGRLADAGRGDGSRALALFLVNRRPVIEASLRDESMLFQVGYRLDCAAGILPRPDLRGEQSDDPDERISDLQYRNAHEYVVGHGVAARPIPATPGQAPAVTAVEIVWLPETEFRPVIANKCEGVEVAMAELGDLRDPATLDQALGGLPGAYEAWIAATLEAEEARAGLSGRRQETLADLAGRARVAASRIRRGIALLTRDRQVLQAFVYANRAMCSQATQRNLRAGRDDPPKWRLFQLAFILLCLGDLAEPTASPSYRDDVELIFFPTGGGKTEAYLGLIAFTLILRRLRGRQEAHGGEGVAVLLRYTLRLLTLDQLERASTLICALEQMRVDPRYRGVLGKRRFEIGLWVGSKASANNLKQFKEQLAAFKADSGPGGKGNPCPLHACPWCGESFTARSMAVETTAGGWERAVVRCHNPACAFSQAPHTAAGLPLHFIDEQIYRELPCFIVATVDKFAMLPWRGETGQLFGRVSHRDRLSYYGPATSPTNIPRAAEALPAGLLPPELIVQDELHLISGPLGTMVGLFETAIEELCVREIDGVRIRPKIIAATATVRRAQRQIQALYGRRATQIFPPQGIDPFETWFSTVDHKKDGRIYLGVAAAGRSMKRVLLRCYLTLVGAAAWAAKSGGASPEAVDGYMTVVGYFNSLRELGGMRRLVEDDINTRAAKQEGGGPLNAVGRHRWVANRMIGLAEELTSRVSSSAIAAIKGKAARSYTEGKGIDVLLASNMISVGVDIPRLAVMVVAGQPKTTAEYIQASSRVGRNENWPGLVVTAYNIYRPRDRSHYEHFVAYHESFYRYVEATSVTPFSAPALDRGLAALVVALARLLDPEMTPSGAVMNQAGLRRVGARILEVIHRKAANQPAIGADGEAAGDAFARTVSERSEGLLEAWRRLVDGTGDDPIQFHYSPLDSHRDRGRELLHTALEARSREEKVVPGDAERFVAPLSMRDVEPSVHVWRRYHLVRL